MKTLKSSDSGFAGSIRRKADFLPTVFVSVEFDNAFIPRLADCFGTMIVTANSKGDRAWADLIYKFDKHALFDLTVPNEIVLGRMEFQLPGADGKLTTRVYEPEPLSFGFERVRIDIDRTRVDNESYRKEASSILAYLFAWRLFVEPLKPHHVALVRVDAVSLSEYLRLRHRGEVSPDSLSRFIIARTIDDLLNDSPLLADFDRAVDRIADSLNARRRS
ncbi:MAG: hypothetical protein SGJ27_26720 [Candidatus Melainabacteria bacterium]|nr:hypothetical protein [Candidatus Melainabacteria bacterium]